LFEVCLAGTLDARQTNGHAQRIAFSFHSQCLVVRPLQSEPDGSRDLCHRDASQGSLFLIGDENQFRGGNLANGINVGHARLFAEPRRHGVGRRQQIIIRMVRTSIDFRHDWRPALADRAEFDDFQDSVV
jgi:hypothetical protein